jgi:hypothetical protein
MFGGQGYFASNPFGQVDWGEEGDVRLWWVWAFCAVVWLLALL